MNFANLISLLRIAFLPIIIYFIYQETTTASSYALILLSLALISTITDDILAKQRKIHSKVGSFLDPFADKILIIGLLFIYLLRGSFWLVPLAIFILRDIIVIIVRWLASQDDVQIYEETYHKIITGLYFALVYSLILQEFFLYQEYFHYITFAYWGVLVFTLVSIVLAVFSMSHHFLLYGKGLRSRKLMGKMVRREKIVILANRKSGGYSDRYRRRLLRIFARRRNAQIHYLPKKQDMFKGMVSETNNFPQVILAGGDGTFEGALNYKPLQKKVLGFFPLGSGNAFYSYFYKGKRFEYLRSRFRFRETELDVLELEWDQGKIETTFINLGIDADVMRLRTKENKRFAGYVAASWRALKVDKSGYNLVCKVNSRKYYLNNCVGLTLGKMSYMGFGVRSLLGKVQSDDGKIYGLASINTHNSYLNKAARFWGFILTIFNLEKAPLLPLKGNLFEVSCQDEFPLQAGGEFLGFTKNIKLNVKRKQKVLVI